MTKEISICFTGDIALSKYYEDAQRDGSFISDVIKNYIQEADYAVFNIEGPICENRGTEVKTFRHVSNEKLVDILRILHNTKSSIWNLANNHSTDAGKEGIVSTIQFAEKNGSSIIGGGLNINEASAIKYIDFAGGIGILSVGQTEKGCPGKLATEEKLGIFCWSRLTKIEQQINEIKSNCRWCVIVAHAGDEFASMPMPYIRNRYLKFLNLGADIIVAHHPHVVQNYEMIGNKAIFYSLGNFIFDTDYQRHAVGSDIGILLKIHFSPDKFNFEEKAIHITRNNDKQIVPCETPVIFTNIDEQEYRRLLPYAAWDCYLARHRSFRYMSEKLYKYSWSYLLTYLSFIRRGLFKMDKLKVPILIILYLIGIRCSEKDNKIVSYLRIKNV